MKQVRINGQVFSVPDNATMDQIQEYLSSQGVRPEGSGIPRAGMAAPIPKELQPSGVLAEQAAKYPTSAEQGGPVGKARVSLLNTILDTAPGAQTQMGPEAAFMGAAAPGNVFAKVPSAIETAAAPTARLAETFGQQFKAGPVGQAVTSAADAIRTQLKPAQEAVSDRLLHSLLRPEKKLFDFGADPIAEAKKLGTNLTEAAMKRANEAKMKASEAALESAAADRAAAAVHVGADDGIDVTGFIKAPLQREIQAAKESNNNELAKSLQGFMDAQFERITNKYGGTYLKPTEIIAEKRNLAQGTKFTQDATAHNMNVARMELYKGLDGALNRLLPQAKQINTSYAGQIELDKLLDRRIVQGKNAPILGETAFGSLKRVVPETLPKTALSRMVRTQQPQRALVGGQVYEFYPRPQPGPYEPGYQPSPEMTGVGPRSETVEGGVYRPSTPAESAGFPKTRSETKLGTRYRPGRRAEDERFP